MSPWTVKRAGPESHTGSLEMLSSGLQSCPEIIGDAFRTLRLLKVPLQAPLSLQRGLAVVDRKCCARSRHYRL
jgi:hypothetical protein